MLPVALTIAGSDPSGGAGIQADLKTFHVHRVYGQAAVTLLTVQNTRGVSEVSPVSAELVAAQVRALLDDMPPAAAKTGALPSPEVVEAVAALFAPGPCPLVVDPVLRATSGKAFSRDDLAHAYRTLLAPRATLLTPNALEAEQLTGIAVRDATSAERAGEALLRAGVRAVLVKGGHLAGEPIDLLLAQDGTREVYRARRVDTPHTHGTGCTYAAAITARLAMGVPLVEAIAKARAWLAAVMDAPLGLGTLRGPLNHFVVPEP